jgi:hypothetical protein
MTAVLHEIEHVPHVVGVQIDCRGSALFVMLSDGDSEVSLQINSDGRWIDIALSVEDVSMLIDALSDAAARISVNTVSAN